MAPEAIFLGNPTWTLADRDRYVCVCLPCVMRDYVCFLACSLLLRVCLALLCVMFIAYLVVPLLLRVCLASMIVCFFGRGGGTGNYVSLAGETVIPRREGKV